MKKHILLLSTLAISMMSAQTNDELMKVFEKQKNENNQKFDSYVSKKYGSSRTPEILKEIEEQRSNLAGFDPSGKPYFNKENDLDQIMNSNSDYLQNGTISGLTGSFNGENIKYTIFDGGRAYQGHLFFNNAANRVNNKEAATMNYSAHATAVTGFIGAKDFPYTITFITPPRTTNFRGIAQNSTFDNYSFATTVLAGDTNTSTVFQKILTAQPKISNHSYGSNPGWDYNSAGNWIWSGNYNSGTSMDIQGSYLWNDQNYDMIVYNNPSYIIVKSAGNSYGMGPTGNTTPAYYYDSSNNQIQFTATDVLPSNNCAQGYDCIGTGSLAKNIIIVGASDILTASDKRYATASDVIKSSYSSAGPRDDGAIKPDIITTGTNVAHASTAENTTGSSLIGVGSGTSYSGPIVTGIIGLWTQINKQLFNNAELNAASAKTLMVHSASEAGVVGPDPWNGWGYINAKKGAELLLAKSNNTIIFNDETLNNNVANKKNVIASGTEPLKVTISWIDPEYTVPSNISWADAYNNRSSRLINDLDLRIIDTTDNTIYYPWKLNANSPMTPATKADNIVDNVEQVVIDAPTPGRMYRIEITNKGNLKNNQGTNAPQNYSILASGYTQQVLAAGETASSNELQIAPTITKNVVNIIKAPQKSTFNIYDFSGKKLQSGTITSDRQTLDLSSYLKGIYIIEIKTDKNTISKKVIKE